MKITFSKILCVLCLASLLIFFFGTGFVDNINAAGVAQQLCVEEYEWVSQ